MTSPCRAPLLALTSRREARHGELGRRATESEVSWSSLVLSGCALALAVLVGVPYLWAIELALLTVLIGYVRRLFGQQARAMSATLEQVDRLSEANELLVSLHRVAQSLPASLNLHEAIGSTMSRLRDLVDCDVAILLLRDDTGHWTAGWAEGTTTGPFSDDDHLPPALAGALGGSVASLVVSLAAGAGLGRPDWPVPDNAANPGCGLYAPLRARGTLVGLIALEHRQPGQYGRRELRLLDGFMEPAALAIDNARWFSRLRTMGADEERNRIARDMHDRVGQSLAYVAFTLERLKGQADASMQGPLSELRSEVRGILADVRETLSDLRADVSDRRGMASTLQTFVDRVAARSDIAIDLVSQETARLPLLQEREMWRIAQEAIINVERHASASHLRIRWDCDGSAATLRVTDNGRGFDPDRPGPAEVNATDNSGPEAFGIRGMRERAGAVGARISIASERYAGTVVECSLGLDPPDRHPYPLRPDHFADGLPLPTAGRAGPEAA